MKLVCIGVGGSGVACLEIVLHLAALGLYPEGCEIVPIALDPDRGHPRISGMTTFLAAYNELRNAGEAADVNTGGLFGARIVRNQALNATKPADQESLFAVLGLADEERRALAGLFFCEEEVGRADSHDFANGFYGRANAGVCFFSDPAGEERLMKALREHLMEDASRVVLFGSAFGGTGAAGLVHVARTIRDDAQLRDRTIPIAVVQLEPYFKPAAPTETRNSGFVNLSTTFERRTAAAYQFLENLASNDNLPFEVLYPLGGRNPSVFPPLWFKRDQQDNPHLWVEYLAALAARDFVINIASPGGRELRLRRVAIPPSFGEPLATMRRMLRAAVCTRSIAARFVLPLLDSFGSSAALPGHPWFHDVLQEAQFSCTDFRQHVLSSITLLDTILGHAGILPASWRTATSTWSDPARVNGRGAVPTMSDADRRRLDEMTQKTRDSLPQEFLPWYEATEPSGLLTDADPATIFDAYSRAHGDALLPIRALFRWALDGQPRAREQPQQGRRDYQLVQQEPDSGDDEVTNLATISDDTFVAVGAKDSLKRLSRAPWKAPERTAPQPNEYPSIWAPAIVYRDALYRAASDDSRYVHLGLLYLALMRYQEHNTVPVYPFRLDHGGLKGVIQSTLPLPDYQAAFGQTEHVLALYLRPAPVFGGAAPRLEEVVAFFYPDTIVVPAAGIDDKSYIVLRDLGKHAAGLQFHTLLRRLCLNWHLVLAASGIPDAATKGPLFVDFLASFRDSPHGSLNMEDRYTKFPSIPLADGSESQPPPWIDRLYASVGAGVA